MKRVFPILVCLVLAACNHTSSLSSVSGRNVTVMPATYAMASPATASAQDLSPNQPRLTSSECAKGFDSTLSYLEYLMEQKAQRERAL